MRLKFWRFKQPCILGEHRHEAPAFSRQRRPSDDLLPNGRSPLPLCKVEPKTVQGLLRHSKIQTTLDLYPQEDSDEMRAAQGSFLSAMGMRPSSPITYRPRGSRKSL
jgi:hypothetical protein